MSTNHIDHYLETIRALERGDTATALVHATLAGHAAVATAISVSDGIFGAEPYPAVIRAQDSQP